MRRMRINCQHGKCRRLSLHGNCYCHEHKTRLAKTLYKPLPWLVCNRHDGTDWLSLPWELLQMILESAYSLQDCASLILSCKAFASIVTAAVVDRMHKRLLYRRVILESRRAVNNTVVVTTCQDGTFHGVYRLWGNFSKDGITLLLEQAHFHRGKLNGKHTLYHILREHTLLSRPIETATYRANKLHGWQRQGRYTNLDNFVPTDDKYYDNGRLVRWIDYGAIDHGVGRGVSVRRYIDQTVAVEELYHPNHTLRAMGKRVGTRKSGLWKFWDSDGNLIDKVQYRNK